MKRSGVDETDHEDNSSNIKLPFFIMQLLLMVYVAQITQTPDDVQLFTPARPEKFYRNEVCGALSLSDGELSYLS